MKSFARLSAVVISIAGLAGCMAPTGGGQPSGSTLPQASAIPDNPTPSQSSTQTASTGYSSASGLFQGVTYDLRPGQMNYATTGTVSQLRTADVKFTPGSNSGILTLNGTAYQMTQVSSSPLTYRLTTENGTLLVQVFTVGANAFIAYVGDNRGVNILDGYMPMGANTNPENLPDTGSASYSGVAVGYANQANGNYTALNGTVNFEVNFEQSTVAGTGSLTTTADSQPFATLILEPTTIVGNTFGASPEIILTNQNATATRSVIQGDFYGPQGQDLAGTFAAEGNDELGHFTVQGAFHSD